VAIREILSQYDKFGWRLDHILLSTDLKDRLSQEASVIFDGIRVEESDLDAAWFARTSTNGRVAWELRSLGPSPFALVDSTEQNASVEDLTSLFQRVEMEMRQRLVRPTQTK
jgi:hypothetical protein